MAKRNPLGPRFLGTFSSELTNIRGVLGTQTTSKNKISNRYRNNPKRSPKRLPTIGRYPQPQPTKAGSATAPRSAFNPVQRCFGYTVRPAPLPFHRTLLVEVVRRYTLLNHKERVGWLLRRSGDFWFDFW